MNPQNEALGKLCKAVRDEAAIPSVTIGAHLDANIAACRKRLEQLCIVKAKAEALQMLDYPRDAVAEMCGWY